MINFPAEMDLRERTQKLAYQYWLDRGRPLGSPDIDWFAAEKQLSEQDDSTEDDFSLYGLALEPEETRTPGIAVPEAFMA